MLVQILIFTVGCTSSEDDFSSKATYFDSPSPSVGDADTALIEDSGVVELGPGPVGLVPIPPIEPQFCMMAYEAHIPESGFGAASQPGHMPSINVSLTQANDRCSETPIRVRGEIVGHLRLASFSEWQDAGDGILGDGGTLYPWGDEPHSGQCILGSGYESFQASGSAQDCHSVFGVFDQIGNIWEWVATDAQADVTAWTNAQLSQGLAIEVSNEHIFVTGSSEQLVTWIPLAVGLTFEGFEIGDDGQVFVLGSAQTSRDVVVGYLGTHQLLLSDQVPVTGDLLPIQIDFSQDPNMGILTSPVQRNGEPIGVKVGGAYYSGWDSTLYSIFLGHVPEFNGTIGFRCVSEPID